MFHLFTSTYAANVFAPTKHEKVMHTTHHAHFTPYIVMALIAMLCTFYSCGEDRSGEQPFAPTVVTRNVEVVADSAILTGQVTESPNSSLIACGFTYGNDTLKVTATSSEVSESFSVVTQVLEAGDYYAVAYAQNGVGTSYGDTLHFSIGN